MFELNAKFFSGNVGQTRWQILQYIATRGTADVRTIAEENNLAASTVRNYIDKYIGIGLLQYSGVADSGETEGPGGRPSRMFRFSPQAGYVAGVEIGRQIIRMNTTDLAGELHSTYEAPLLSGSNVSPGSSIVGIVNRGLEQSGIDRRQIIGIGVGVQGLFYGPDDVWLYWPSVKSLVHLPLQSILTRELGLPTIVDDHGRARLLAERQYGVLNHQQDAVLVWVGTGVAAYFCFDGKVFQGTHGMNGEFGHLKIEADGPLCTCGRRGCLEAVASIPSIVQDARQRLEQSGLSALSPLTGHNEPISIRDIVDAEKQGDQIAFLCLRQAGERIGRAIGVMLNVIGPSLVVIAGELRHSPVTMQAIHDAVVAEVIQPLVPKIEIQSSQLSEGAGVLGAALRGIEDTFTQPRIPSRLLSVWAYGSGEGPTRAYDTDLPE